MKLSEMVAELLIHPPLNGSFVEMSALCEKSLLIDKKKIDFFSTSFYKYLIITPIGVLAVRSIDTV